MLGSRSGRTLVALAAGLLIATLLGLALLWPADAARRPGTAPAPNARTLAATVTALEVADCGGPVAQECAAIRVRLDEGPDRAPATFTLGPVGQTSQLRAGDDVRVTRSPLPEGVAAATTHRLSHAVDQHTGSGQGPALLDIVRLRVAHAGQGAGTIGAVVELYNDAVELEVVDDYGRTVFLRAVPVASLELVG